MAAFIGYVKGCRGGASRLGSKGSGLRASACSYDGSIISRLRYDDNNELIIDIGLADGSSCYSDKTIFHGTRKELDQMIEVYNLFKAGKIKVKGLKAWMVETY